MKNSTPRQMKNHRHAAISTTARVIAMGLQIAARGSRIGGEYSKGPKQKMYNGYHESSSNGPGGPENADGTGGTDVDVSDSSVSKDNSIRPEISARSRLAVVSQCSSIRLNHLSSARIRLQVASYPFHSILRW
ncbi:hypothetical protein IAT40_001255 [Kwoniella sp. CBS 6097]